MRKDGAVGVALLVAWAMTLAPTCLFHVLGAPVPRKPKASGASHGPRPVQIVAGSWEMTWDGCTEPMPLGIDGSYSWTRLWKGSWAWEGAPKERIFLVNEWNGSRWYTWWAKLDEVGRGVVEGDADFAGVRILVRRAK